MTESRYPEIYARWQSDPEGFWSRQLFLSHWTVYRLPGNVASFGLWELDLRFRN